MVFVKGFNSHLRLEVVLVVANDLRKLMEVKAILRKNGQPKAIQTKNGDSLKCTTRSLSAAVRFSSESFF